MFIGRERELASLNKLYDSDKFEFVVLYGRRRVGKTYLVKYFFKENFDFFFTGSFETPMKVQLALFKDALFQYSGVERSAPKNWFEAFDQLKEHV